LAYLQIFPDKKAWNQPEEYTNEDTDQENNSRDSVQDAQEEAKILGSTKRILWTFEALLDAWKIYREGKQLTNPLQELKKWAQAQKNYRPLKLSKGFNPDTFIKDNYLWFALIVPNTEIKNGTIESYYAKTFRFMNYFGKKLSASESRRSLYYLNTKYTAFFEGNYKKNHSILDGLTIQHTSTKKSKKTTTTPNEPIDYIRYLSILAQYSLLGKDQSEKILCGFSQIKNREQFYTDFIAKVTGLPSESKKDVFDGLDVEPFFTSNSDLKKRYTDVAKAVNDFIQLRNPGKEQYAFPSWVEADFFLFGLLYIVIFEGKTIQITQNLLAKLETAQQGYRTYWEEKSPNGLSRNPNQLKFLRDRIVQSIDLFS
jgi:hypothetical protein